jgi:hypothetical protein
MSNVSKNVLSDTARPAGALTVQALADAKKLPASFLLQLGLYDLPKDGGVGIPYRDRAGELIAVRRRTAAKDPPWANGWPARTPAAAYGQWKIGEPAKAGFLFLVAGESDCWTLWHHGLPALGLPAFRWPRSRTKTLSREHLGGVSKVYLHGTFDLANDLFREDVSRRLAKLKFTGQVFTFRTPPEIDDLSDLHLEGAEKFVERMEVALKSAEQPFPVPPLPRGAKGGGAAPQPVYANSASAETDSATEERQRCTIRLIDVPEEKVQWLWPGRIPLGKLTILDGDPGLGKSTVTLDLAARLTRGKSMPATPEACLPASNVVMLTAEDGLGDTVRPRLVAAGADLSNLIAFRGITYKKHGTLAPIYLPNNVHDLAEVVKESQAKLLLIDPLMAYLPESINAHNDQSVRQALLPLAQLAEATGAAVVVVRHLNKQAGKSAIYRGSGSIGIIGAARSGLLACKDPDHPKRRLLGVTKGNLCQQPKTVPFELLDNNGVPIVQWQEEVDLAIEKALACDGAEEDESRSEADEFLLARLADGPLPVANLFKEGQALQLTEKVLRRARKRLKITTRMIPEPTGKGGRWVWELPRTA